MHFQKCLSVGLLLGGNLNVLQAPMFDDLLFDPFSLFDDGWCPAEVRTVRRNVVNALMVVMLNNADDFKLHRGGLPHSSSSPNSIVLFKQPIFNSKVSNALLQSTHPAAQINRTTKSAGNIAMTFLNRTHEHKNCFGPRRSRH